MASINPSTNNGSSSSTDSSNSPTTADTEDKDVKQAEIVEEKEIISPGVISAAVGVLGVVGFALYKLRRAATASKPDYSMEPSVTSELSKYPYVNQPSKTYPKPAIPLSDLPTVHETFVGNNNDSRDSSKSLSDKLEHLQEFYFGSRSIVNQPPKPPTTPTSKK